MSRARNIGARTGVLTNDNLLHVQDKKASGTDGQTLTGNAWVTRDLSSVKVNNITGASLSSNQITLPAGDYHINGTALARYVGSSKIALYNITDAEFTVYGVNADPSGSDPLSVDCNIIDNFSISSAKTFEIRQWSNESQTGAGGEATGGSITGVDEIYANIRIWRIG